MRHFYAVVVLLLFACTTMKYVDDTDFLVSAQADSPEFPVYINGKICKDTDGIPGLCSKRIKSNEALVLRMDARPYSYRLQLNCTRELGESQPFAVPKDQPFEHTIQPEKIALLKSFICIGEILPDDRGLPISAKWEVRAKVVDRAYTQRETPYILAKKNRKFLILGQHAKFTSVFDNGEWTDHHEEPVVEIHGNPDQVKAYSESFNMRFNSTGF